MTHTHSLTVAQAAEALGVSERTVWRYLKSGRLEGVTVGPVGGQRTLIPAERVDALRTNRSGDTDATELRERLEQVLADLARVQAERDDLARRVGNLQRALARPAPTGVIERAATGMAGALARLRSPRTAA